MGIMNIAIGAMFMCLGAVFFAQSKKAEHARPARLSKFAGALFMLAGMLFLVAAAIPYLT